MFKLFLKKGLLVFIYLIFNSLVLLGGPEKCSQSNYKFNKTYTTIKHSLLPNDIWRNEKEKETFFNCVKSEEKFVSEVIGQDKSVSIEKNIVSNFGPDGVGTLMPGNRRNLHIIPIEIKLTPGEYIAVVQYIGGISYMGVIPYYSSESVEFENKEYAFAGSWDFRYGVGFFPRLYDTIKFKVKSSYSNGKKVNLAVVRFMLSAAYMETISGTDFAIIDASHPAAKNFLSTPFKNATKINKYGIFE